MTSKKCIFKANDREDEDTASSVCFQLNANIQLKEIPTNGEEYLLTVVKERQTCARVTKCNEDLSKFAKNQSCFVKELPHAKAPDGFKPTIEWQNIQVADFSDVRMYISRLLANTKLWPDNFKKIDITQDNIIGWKHFLNKQEPTLSCVLALPNAMVDRGLEIIVEILDDVEPGNSIDHKTGQWIYAFLACTRLPLLSDTTSILRNLARKCALIRSLIDQSNADSGGGVTPLNIFICLIARYFQQFDLAD